MNSKRNITALMLLVGLLGCGAKTDPPASSPPPVKTESPPAVSPEDPTPKAAKPEIMTRKEWKAKPPRGEGKEHTIKRITVHHTGVNQNFKLPIEKKLQNLQHFSQNESKLASGKTKPAWLDVPYHFYIAVDGKIAEGREIRTVSDTNTEYDPTEHATIVVEGNFETEQPSEEQLKSLDAMVAWLAEEYQVPADRVQAHNDFAKTACPGVNLKKLMPEIREKIAK